MCPEIRINGKPIADVPDETGWHQALDGSPLYVNVDRIEASNGRQILGLEGFSVGGQRIVGLTQEGKGNSDNLKKGGDKKEPVLDVSLHHSPIRRTYTATEWNPSRSLSEPGSRGYSRDVRRTDYKPWRRRR